MKPNLTVKIIFNFIKYSILIFAISFIEILGFVALSTVLEKLPLWLFISIVILEFIGVIISWIFAIKILIEGTERMVTYTKLYQLYNQNPKNIRKSILLEMNETLCWREVTKQLVKDFNIEL